MRSGAAAAKAEVWVGKPVLLAAPPHLGPDRWPSRLPPLPAKTPSLSPSEWEKGLFFHPSYRPRFPQHNPRRASPDFARLQHGGPSTSGRKVRLEFPRPSRRSGPSCRQAAPTYLSKAPASLRTEASGLHGLQAPGDSWRLPERTFILEEADSPRAVFCFVLTFKKLNPRVLSPEGISSPKRRSFPFF